MSNLLRQTATQLRPSHSNGVSASIIRKTFLDYFREHDHIHIHSSPVFSLFDPTLAFINSGMNQFKDVFLGIKQPASNRVVNSQKCIRVGGKHNDLSQVGQDGTHHSFFEMLGNWSFGDYFKKEACKMSWDLLTRIYRLPPERLYVTYWGGDKTMELSPDYEVREIWRGLGVEDTHIIPCDASYNFWEMGSSGPCGTCTEIHYDHTPGRTNAQSLVNSGDPHLTELWNLVFIEYNRKLNGNLENLKKHFVDTGMGFERLVAALQNKTSNYDTDLFSPLFEAIKIHSGHSGYTGEYGENEMDRSYRILADHGRMIAVALSDGMLPNQQKSLLICTDNFKSNESLLKEVTNYVASTLADAYPQIGENLAKIHYIIDAEMEIFKNQREIALKKWLKVKIDFPDITVNDIVETPQLIEGLNYIKKNIIEMGKRKIQDDDGWKLLDTLGVPLEIICKVASLLGLEFDTSSFKEYVALKKNLNKKTFEEKFHVQLENYVDQNIISEIEEMNLEPSKNSFKYDYRVNSSGQYKFLEQPATIEAIICNDEILDSITEEKAKGQSVGFLLDRTQMFCENNSQESDTGTFIIEKNIIFDLQKVIECKGYTFHFGVFTKFPSSSPTVKVNNIGILKLDESKRLKMMKNRTALHLLKDAIRRRFLVTGEKFSKVTPQQLLLHVMIYNEQLNLNDAVEIEDFVRNIIRHGVSVTKKLFPYQKFVNLKDVIVLPGNHIIEAEIPVVEINSGFFLSRRHCTEAHVCNTSDLGDFLIKQIKTTLSNVKIIEAVTGEEAFLIRKNDKKFEEEWERIGKKLSEISSFNYSQLKEVESKLKNLEKEVEDECGGWILKKKIVTDINEKRHHVKSLKKNAFGKLILDKVRESPKGKFIFHGFEFEEEKNQSKSLKVALTARQDLPILIFIRTKNHIAAGCFVPKEMINENFNPRNWCTAFLGSSNVKKNEKEEESETGNYLMTEKRLTNEELEKGKERAEDFVRKYMAE